MPSAPVVTHALSVMEPWGWAVTTGFKSSENRSWAFPAKRHPLPAWLAIHTSLSLEQLLDDDLTNWLGSVHPDIEPAYDHPCLDATPMSRALGRSEIVGVAKIIDCVRVNQDDFRDRVAAAEAARSVRMHSGIPIESWRPATGFMWLIGDVYRFRSPIVAIGRLNVWAMSPELQNLVAEQLARSMAEQEHGIERHLAFEKSVIHEMPKIPKNQQALYE